MGLIHNMTRMKGSTKLRLSRTCSRRLPRQYFRESQCILAMRRPGKVKREPSKPQLKARKNFTTILEAGPLEICKFFIKEFIYIDLIFYARRGQTLLSEEFGCTSVETGVGILKSRFQNALIDYEDYHCYQ